MPHKSDKPVGNVQHKKQLASAWKRFLAAVGMDAAARAYRRYRKLADKE